MLLRSALGFSLMAVVACANENPWLAEDDPETPVATCTGLRLQTLSDVAVPPANVAALVRVTDCDGEPLGRSLDEASFQILENGNLRSSFEARRMVTPLARATKQRTLVVVDLSGSILLGGHKSAMVDGVRSLAADLAGENHEVAVYGFDGRPDLVPIGFFTSEMDEVELALGAIMSAEVVDDSTNLNGAVLNAVMLLDEAVKEIEERDVIAQGNLVLFTDGRDLAARVSLSRALDAVRGADHTVFTIGLGADIDNSTLSAIGADGSFFVAHRDGIVRAFEHVSARLAALARRDYFVSYCTPARAGGHELTIRAKDGDRVGEAKISFFADGFGAGCRPETVPLARP